jgi:hypothetical protein
LGKKDWKLCKEQNSFNTIFRWQEECQSIYHPDGTTAVHLKMTFQTLHANTSNTAFQTLHVNEYLTP